MTTYYRAGRPCRTVLLTILLAIGCGLISTSVASAAAYEPNDSLGRAAGPVAGGATYSAAYETDNDVDVFALNNTKSDAQIHVNAWTTDPEACGDVNVYDRDGSDWSDIMDWESWDIDQNGNLDVTLNKPGRYYLVFDNGCVGTYNFRVDDPSASLTTQSLASTPRCRFIAFAALVWRTRYDRYRKKAKHYLSKSRHASSSTKRRKYRHKYRSYRTKRDRAKRRSAKYVRQHRRECPA